MNTSEATLDNLVNADWWDNDYEWATHRTDAGVIIVFARDEMYVINGEAITRTYTGSSERVILD